MSSNATAGARGGGGGGGGNSNGGNFLSVPPTPGVVYAPADPGINDNWEMGKLAKISSINYHTFSNDAAANNSTSTIVLITIDILIVRGIV